MDLGQQSTVVLFATLALYAGVGVGLLIRRWPVRAGLATGAIAFLPLIWQRNFTDSDAPGFGLLVFLLLAISVSLIALGLVLAIYRLVRDRGRPREPAGRQGS